MITCSVVLGLAGVVDAGSLGVSGTGVTVGLTTTTDGVEVSTGTTVGPMGTPVATTTTDGVEVGNGTTVGLTGTTVAMTSSMVYPLVVSNANPGVVGRYVGTTGATVGAASLIVVAIVGSCGVGVPKT
jgi:hypothetical protein